jgi:hypothetical protein
MAEKVALLIATSTYQYPGLTGLTSPVNDVQALAEVLEDPRIGGFRVKTLIDPTTEQAGAAIGTFYAESAPEQLTLLYYSGHGIRHEESRQLHLAMRDTNLANLVFTSVPATSIDLAMTTALSFHKVVILDCCYAGAFPPGGKARRGLGSQIRFKELEGAGRTVLTSSGATEFSFETPPPGGVPVRHGAPTQSVFTRHLVAGLRDGSADTDHDGDVSVDELYKFAFDRVIAENPQQRPRRMDSVEGGTIVLAANPCWELPGDVRADIDSADPHDRVAAVGRLTALYERGNAHVRQETLGELLRLAADPSAFVARAALRPLRGILPPDRLPTPTAAGASDEGVPVTPAQLLAAGVQMARGAVRRGSARTEAAWRTARVRVRPVLPYALPLLAAALMAGGLFLPDDSGGSVFPYPGYGPERRQASDVSLAVMGIAVLVAVAARLGTRPRTRRLLGPGLLCGAAAASLWNLLAYVGMTHHMHEDGVLYPVWELTAHGLLLLSVAGPAVRLARERDVVLRCARPRGTIGWALSAGGAGALALALWALAGVLYRTRAAGDDYLTDAHLALAVLCVAVPVLAALLGPARAALGVLAGFTAGAALVGGNEFAVVASRTQTARESYGGPRDAAIFAVAELLVLACALLLARRPAAVPRSRGRRMALAAVLVLVPPLAGGGAVRVVAAHDWQRLDTYTVERIVVSADGRTLSAFATNALVGAVDRPVRNREFVIDTATRQIVRVVPLPDDGILPVAGPDGHTYILSGDGTRITVRDSSTGAVDGAPITTVSRENDFPSLQLSQDGRTLVLVYDKTAVVYDTRARRSAGLKMNISNDDWWKTLSPDGRRLYAVQEAEGSTVRTLHAYDMDDPTQSFTVHPVVGGRAVRISIFSVSPDGRRLYVGVLPNSGDGGHDAVLVLDARTGRQIGAPVRVPGTGKGISALELSPDGSRLFVLDDRDPDSFEPVQQGTISQFDTRTWTATGPAVVVPPGHGGLTVGPDGGAFYLPVAHGLSVIPAADPAARTTIRVGLGDPTPWGP